MIKFFPGSCPEWIRDRFERTIYDLTLKIYTPIKAETFINSLCRFFHYEPLFTSSFGKNLIIPEAVIFSKAKMLPMFNFSKILLSLKAIRVDRFNRLALNNDSVHFFFF